MAIKSYSGGSGILSKVLGGGSGQNSTGLSSSGVPQYQGAEGVMGKLSSIIGGAKAGSSGGPWGAVIGGVVGAGANNKAKQAGALATSAMGRRKDAMGEDMTKPGPQAILKNGWEALHDQSIPEDIRQRLAPLFIASQTHGSNGLDANHIDFGFGDTQQIGSAPSNSDYSGSYMDESGI